MKSPVFFPQLFPVKSVCSHYIVRSFFNRSSIMAHGQRGFTLLELLIVLAILAVLGGLGGIGLLRGMPERRLMNAAREIYGTLRQAQSRAVARGTLISVKFNPESGTLSMADAAGKRLGRKSFPGYIDLYKVTGDNEEKNHYFFNPRGIKTGVSGSIHIRYRKPGYVERRVVVRSTGAMRIQRSGDNGETWQ